MGWPVQKKHSLKNLVDTSKGWQVQYTMKVDSSTSLEHKTLKEMAMPMRWLGYAYVSMPLATS